MKYCLKYSTELRFLDSVLQEVDEIEVDYLKLKNLKNFLALHKEQTILINMTNVEYSQEIADKLITLHENYKNFKLFFPFEKEYYPYEELGIPYGYISIASSWADIYGMTYGEHSPSDIFVGFELGFSVAQVAEKLHNQNIQVRCWANIAQRKWESIPAYKSFFIRPEDIRIYDNFVDVCHLHYNTANPNYAKIALEVYRDKHKWFGNLNEFILNLNYDVDSRRIVPAFSQARTKCEGKCFKTGRCAICERAIELTQTMENNDIIVRIDKYFD